jgi:hypothetical protein
MNANGGSASHVVTKTSYATIWPLWVSYCFPGYRAPNVKADIDGLTAGIRPVDPAFEQQISTCRSESG